MFMLRRFPLLPVAFVSAVVLTATEPADTDARQGPANVPVAKIMEKFTGDLDEMVKRRYIRVAVTYSKTHYFIDRGVQRGATYEATKLFEDELNTKLKTGNLRVNMVFLPMSRDELLPAVMEGRADMAPTLGITAEWQKMVDFSDPTTSGVSAVVVTSADAPTVSTPEDLSGRKVFVRKASAAALLIGHLNEKLRAAGRPEVQIDPAPETFEEEDVLEMVNAGLVKATVTASHLATFWKQLFPNIQIHDTAALTTDSAIGVAVRKSSPKLLAEINAWIKRHGPKTTFGNMMVRRYLQNTRFARSATDPAEMKRFQSMVDIFRKYGETYDLDYVLMAAQGFQESQLNQKVRSPVGAVGVMQVMPATGKDMKTGDISQIEPNIHAGIKYIRFMVDQYFEKEPMDRLNKMLFAFAAFNAGPGRVSQLRRTAEARKLNPNVWFNNVEQIASERIGRETVTYVSNIYKYYVAYRLAMQEAAERRQQKQGAVEQSNPAATRPGSTRRLEAS
jgi:membrane-bound lytic murein transglycosylase MltF